MGRCRPLWAELEAHRSATEPRVTPRLCYGRAVHQVVERRAVEAAAAQEVGTRAQEEEQETV